MANNYSNEGGIRNVIGEHRLTQGYVQVYTGDGKGKSTAAFGLALRARGAGLAVTLLQFIKNKDYSEIAVLKSIGVTVRQFGNGLFFGREPEERDLKLARDGLEEVRRLFRLEDGRPDLLILDEVNVALALHLIGEEEFHGLLDQRPSSVELVCTGRRAPESVIRRADLVTEMKAVKHYYQGGVPARDGIER